MKYIIPTKKEYKDSNKDNIGDSFFSRQPHTTPHPAPPHPTYYNIV